VWDHVGIRVSDRQASRRFYESLLGVLGYEITHPGEHFDEWNDFGIAPASPERPTTRHLHVAFVARSRDDVDAFWRTGVDAGYESDGEPGERPQYSPGYYGAFLLDPDGNSAEAIHAREPRTGDNLVDHLWIGVADLAASRRFYTTIAPVVGVEIPADPPERERFHVFGGGRSFGLVHDGRPATEHVHLAFGVPDNATVDEFHRAATAAGYRDNGPPGERAVYHEGYYGAFVLDPDGNNVEAVCHNRRG
jgi:catechol 2,3-dioxygenase-like lactoylglutathione lyase family enzyme